jgi:2-haloacid dehalogenase
MDPPRALFFDVFGTCVDWRSSIIREGQVLGAAWASGRVDWAAVADAWRALSIAAVGRLLAEVGVDRADLVAEP